MEIVQVLLTVSHRNVFSVGLQYQYDWYDMKDVFNIIRGIKVIGQSNEVNLTFLLYCRTSMLSTQCECKPFKVLFQVRHAAEW